MGHPAFVAGEACWSFLPPLAIGKSVPSTARRDRRDDKGEGDGFYQEPSDWMDGEKPQTLPAWGADATMYAAFLRKAA
jgi:hypothetical protein